MSNIVERLHKDHVHIARVLNVLEQQLAEFHKDKIPNYALMMDAMHYLMHYCDEFHHPNEDILLGALKKRKPATPVADELTQQHIVLADKGRRFFDCLQRADSEEMIARQALEKSGYDYVGLLREHMHKEENDAFPLALRALRAEDWHAIDAAVKLHADPVSGESVAEEYRALYNYLAGQQQQASK
jgi:hemerythrin-like domain-containing protein